MFSKPRGSQQKLFSKLFTRAKSSSACTRQRLDRSLLFVSVNPDSGPPLNSFSVFFWRSSHHLIRNLPMLCLVCHDLSCITAFARFQSSWQHDLPIAFYLLRFAPFFFRPLLFSPFPFSSPYPSRCCDWHYTHMGIFWFLRIYPSFVNAAHVCSILLLITSVWLSLPSLMKSLVDDCDLDS